jgi:two-component system response regulator FixJ
MNTLLYREPSREGISRHRAGQAGKPVFIINSDPMLRDMLVTVLARAGYHVCVFASAEAFLAAHSDATRGVLVTDLQVRRMSGIALLSELQRRNANLPVVFLTGRNHLKTCVSAMKQGAFNILEKPVDGSELMGALREAFLLVAQEDRKRKARDAIEKRCAGLTPRETEVMLFIVKGLSNREIAQSIGVSIRTVEVHRSRVMGKMRADTLPDLVRQVALCRNCSSLDPASVQRPEPGR